MHDIRQVTLPALPIETRLHGDADSSAAYVRVGKTHSFRFFSCVKKV